MVTTVTATIREAITVTTTIITVTTTTSHVRWPIRSLKASLRARLKEV